jgi:hypothetical protein
VCLGNICRSPAAEIIFRQQAADAGRADEFHIDSAGTIGHHQGSPPDSRMSEALKRQGFMTGTWDLRKGEESRRRAKEPKNQGFGRTGMSIGRSEKSRRKSAFGQRFEKNHDSCKGVASAAQTW